MHDIARLADVSLGTVSHVITGNVGVRPEVRARVQKVIDELKYKPNYLSRALRTNRTNLIGMIIPDIMNPFFPQWSVVWKTLRSVPPIVYSSAMPTTIRQKRKPISVISGHFFRRGSDAIVRA
jgi:Bacterial regulatory proteins, lacI family